MERSVDVSVALDTLNRAISELNIQITNGDTQKETQEKLDKFLKVRQEIFEGNMLLVDEIINGNLDV